MFIPDAIMSFLRFVKKTLMSDSPESSKRFSGMLGWVSCLIVTYTCLFANIEIKSDIVELLTTAMYISAGLLGLDSIVSVFKKKE